MPVLEVARLAVRYGRAQQALKGVDLECGDGQVVTVLGGNGAGKSTLMRAVSGVLSHHRGSVESGSITYDGRSLVGMAPAEIVAAGLAHVPEGRRVFGAMTVEENLRAGGVLVRGRSALNEARDRVYGMFPRLAERRTQQAGLLSGGEQQMLAIGRGLMSGPRLLLLDEPSLGLAPRVVAEIAGVVREVRAQGTAVLLVEQNATTALSVADHAYVLEVGRVAVSGAPDELSASGEVRRRYLGMDGSGEPSAVPEPTVTRTLGRWTS